MAEYGKYLRYLPPTPSKTSLLPFACHGRRVGQKGFFPQFDSAMQVKEHQGKKSSLLLWSRRATMYMSMRNA